MLYLLHGKDTYRRDARVAEIRSAYRKKHPEALGEHVLDASDGATFDELAQSVAGGGGLFDAKSLIIAKGFAKADNARLHELLSAYRVPENPDTVVVLVEQLLGKRDAEIVKIAEEEVFTPLKQADRAVWIARFIRAHGPKAGPLRIQKQAAAMLAGIGDDLGVIAQEIERVLMFAAGEDVVTEAHIETLLTISKEETVFPLSDGVGDRKPKTALAALAWLTHDGGDARGLLNYTLREARQLIRAHAAQDGAPEDSQKLFGAKPFTWRKRSAQAGKWDEGAIRKLTKLVREADAKSKSGMDAKEALEYFIVKSAQLTG